MERIIEKYTSLFDGIELLYRKRIEYNKETILDSKIYSSAKTKLNKILSKAKINYNNAKKMFYNGQLSNEELEEFKSRVYSIKNELINLK